MTAVERREFCVHISLSSLPIFIIIFKMERVEELRQNTKEAFEAFHRVQREKWQFLQNFHDSAMEILLKEMSDNLRVNLETYLEMRNGNLTATLKNMDEYLHQASAVLADIKDYRLQLVQACNHNIQPPFTSPEEESILVNGQGIKDLENISSDADECVMQVSELQEQAYTLMNTLWQNLSQKIGMMMSEVVVEMKKHDEGRLREVEEVWQRGNEELDEAVQVLENMEKVKQHLECLCEMFRKPDY
ncbi:uncharacterized protein LOC123514238 isoform X1 [Portunus trituberculatus]|uniref:uncharacterized protein LOC123514238 isoform X1 n=1 Tax=Portunus trituberculatus TaxID=210409 RepID=UPI001E1CF14D|nr:uncharacterized protein LOC123514238 isoform X1 [Portunus trituberculatus]